MLHMNVKMAPKPLQRHRRRLSSLAETESEEDKAVLGSPGAFLTTRPGRPGRGGSAAWPLHTGEGGPGEGATQTRAEESSTHPLWPSHGIVDLGMVTS